MLALFVLVAMGLEIPPALGAFEEVFSLEFDRMVIDFDMDEESRLYFLTETEESLFVTVLDAEGQVVRELSAFKGQTPKPFVLQVIASDNGQTVLVRGEDTELETPINWVFDESGEDILPFDHLLKYAEWLQLSPSGNYFTAQGYRALSTIGQIYDIEFNEVEWPRRAFYQGLFVGADGEDIVLFTEADTGGTALAMAKLPSQEIIFSRPLGIWEAHMLPHRGRVAMHNDLLVMMRPPGRGSDVIGIDAKTGRVLWQAECLMNASGVSFSDDGSYIAVFGGPSIMIFNNIGDELAFFQNENSDIPLFAPGIPNFTFFEDRRAIVTKLYIPEHRYGMRSVVLGFDDEWGSGGSSTAFFNFEGFSRDAGRFAAFHKDGILRLLKLISD
ncbi:MAG TPA: hypothetical protein ENN07_08065 [candidate division Zixibacteria bacterium]|nr:hypothetical protein [candidate division Zixibacteria bacterium]